MGLDFPDGPRVLSDFSVDGKQSDAFHAGLRNEHAIERVFVDRRQIADRCGLRAGDRQFEIAVRGTRANAALALTPRRLR